MGLPPLQPPGGVLDRTTRFYTLDERLAAHVHAATPWVTPGRGTRETIDGEYPQTRESVDNEHERTANILLDMINDKLTILMKRQGYLDM